MGLVRLSVIVGLIGAAVDVAAGSLWLLSAMGPSSMMGTWIGMGLVGFGVVVLVTTIAMWGSPSGAHALAYGGLMVAYGIAMFALGAAMWSDLLSGMAGSDVSGTAMFLVGAAMVYSGVSMIRM